VTASTPASGALIASRVYTVAGDPPPRRGNGSRDVRSFSPGAVAWENGIITYVGPPEGLNAQDADEYPNSCVTPGFVDCHTHLPFYGWRADEYAARLSGLSYRDLHGTGGIPRSAQMLASAGDTDVIAFCEELAREMLRSGTTTLELKTGYGLSIEAEIRQARLARTLAERIEQRATVTLLCHTVPPGAEREAWVHAFTRELIPSIAAERLADAVDIYVEDIAFSAEDMRAVSQAALAAGMRFRAHADQLGNTGAAEAAVGVRARSADHLNNVDPRGVAALGSAEATVAVLLPASTLMLRMQPPPVRQLLDAGAAIAISTDLNPGTSPVSSMPEVIALACSMYGLGPEEALTAATVNPAWVLGVDDRVGSLEVGKRADMLVIDGEDFVSVPYRPGHNPVRNVYVNGRDVTPRVS
jgi:imidazolonepropionase